MDFGPSSSTRNPCTSGPARLSPSTTCFVQSIYFKAAILSWKQLGPISTELEAHMCLSFLRGFVDGLCEQKNLTLTDKLFFCYICIVSKFQYFCLTNEVLTL